MSDIFLKVLNLSINASWLIVAVLILRLFLKKAPRWISCALWGLIAIRLVCPFSLQSSLSLVPSSQVIPETIVSDRGPVIDTGISVINDTVNPVITENFTPAVGDGVNPLQIYTVAFSLVWICGGILLIVYAFVSFLLLKRRVRASIPTEKGVMLCDEIKTPFILGVLHPVIYIPSSVHDGTFEMVLAHEKAHLKRCDHLWKPIGFAILIVNWFNPLCWLSYILLCRDIEAACDEKVIKEKDSNYIAAYSQALLDLSVTRRFITASPLAFGESGVKERVKNVLNYKRPTIWIIILAIAACVVVSVCFMTNPKNEPDLSFLNYNNAMALVVDVPDVQVIYYPPDETEEASVIRPGYVGGNELARYLDGVEWKKSSVINDDLPSPGSFEIQIEDDYRITIYKDRRLAVVRYGDDKRFYRTGKGDYEKAVALLYTEQTGSNDGKINVTRPSVNLSDSIGADVPRLLYADNDRIIFSGYFGLFVYSKSLRDFTTSVDLEPIGCNHTQGEDACDMFVSDDGNRVYMHPVSDDEMYVYDIQTDLLMKASFDLSGVSLHEIKPNEEGELVDVWDGEDRRMTTRLSYASCIGELGYIECGLTSADRVIPYYPFFTPNGLSGVADFSPKDIQDIVSADIWISHDVAEQLRLEDGKEGLLHCEDKEVLSEITEMLSKAGKLNGQTGCPFETALYLTKSDGSIGWVFPATDSCDKIIANGECYQYADEYNEEFWKLIAGFDEVSN